MNLEFQNGRPRGSALAISLLVHSAVIFISLNAPGYRVPARAPSEYKQKIEGRDTKLVWYKFRKELPRVEPLRKPPKNQPLRAEVKAPQAIVSAPKNAPKRAQMVWTPAPELAPAPLLESPNILAVKLAPKPFVAPAARPVDSARSQLASDAPVLEARVGPSAELPQLKLPPKVYVAPPPVRIAVARVIAPVEAPQLAATPPAGTGSSALATSKLPSRPFTAPPGPAAAASRGISTEAEPSIDLPATSRDLNVAIVGLNPLEKMVPPPTVSSRAEFSAGPQPRAAGSASDGASAGLTVPELFVRGARPPKPDLIAEAYASPTSSASLRAAMRSVTPSAIVHTDASVPSESVTGTRVSGAPDARFAGRDVYLMAIQMPNLTSYSGSWLMWYSGRTAREVGLAAISAPVPHRKVDPKYVATAVEERIEGKVQLACVIDRDGRVSSVELVRGIDDRLNESAREALSKWQFYPALRAGAPVDVDVLVEIPFRLAPRLAAR